MTTEKQLGTPSGKTFPATWKSLIAIGYTVAFGLILFGLLPDLLEKSMAFHIVRFSDPKTELPLRPPVSLAVAKEGTFYVGLQYWSRIQLYDADGRFLRGFPIESSGGIFHMGFDDLGRLYAYVARGNTRIIFDREGKPVDEEHFDGFDLPSNYWNQSSLTHYQSEEGITADIERDREGFWVVVRNANQGDAHLVRLKDSTGWSFFFVNDKWDWMFSIGLVLSLVLYIVRKKGFPGIPFKNI